MTNFDKLFEEKMQNKKTKHYFDLSMARRKMNITTSRRRVSSIHTPTKVVSAHTPTKAAL